MSTLTIAGFELKELVVGKPFTDDAIKPRPGIVVVKDTGSGKYAVADTPDLLATLNLHAKGEAFNKVFTNKYHEDTPNHVRVFYRQTRAADLKTEFELSRNHCRMALLGELAPIGQDGSVYRKLKEHAERGSRYYGWLCRMIPDLADRMGKFHE